MPQLYLEHTPLSVVMRNKVVLTGTLDQEAARCRR